MKKFDIFYFSSTHWDREWYQDFQGFRYRLVKMTDKLLDLIESDPEYKTFHFDGQTIVLEDYTEICPEKKEKLTELIRERKILIGPWYVMPDEFLLSGESLIRNLMTGHKIAKDFGTESWKHGYVCDIFGHIAQMPQIFGGFGIKSSTVGRGLNEDSRSFFRWQSPDGTECVTHALEPEHGYGGFNYIYRNEFDKTTNNEQVVKNIQAYIEAEIARSDVPVVVLMDGLDHADAAVNTTEYIAKIAELYPEATIHHINLCEGMQLAEKHSDKMPVVVGELNKTAKRGHSFLHLITHTLSSHYPVKQQNDICQNLLEKRAEPICALAELEGISLNRNYIKTAYRYLIQNHPHDSICGCSVDQVHKDMIYRFDQVKEIADVFCGDYLNQSFKKDKPTAEKLYTNILQLQNLLPYDVEKTVTVDLNFKQGYATKYSEPFGYEPINSFKIYDCDGNEVPYQVVSIKRGYLVRDYNSTVSRPMDIHTVSFLAKMPAMSKAEYKIVNSFEPSRYLKKMKSGVDYAENDLVRLDILHNGSIKLTDKKTGKSYSGLGNLVNDGEMGDGWFHANPVNDEVISSVGGDSTIAKIESGPSRCVFKVTRNMTVPAKLVIAPFGKTRSEDTVTLKIVGVIGLSAENRYVDVKLSFENTAKDHRMRLMLPTGITTDKYFAGQAFYCCNRKVGIDYSTQNQRETDPYEKAMNGIVGKRDEQGDGIAFISAEGLHECAAFDDEEGTLGVTLSRSFYTTFLKNGESYCQLNRPLDYSFAIAAIDREVSYNDLLKVQDSLALDVPASFVTVEPTTEPAAPTSAIKVGGSNIATSIIKCAESGNSGEIIVRVFNASDKNTDGFISTAKGIKKAELVNLNEEYIEDVASEKNTVSFTLTPWKIATFKLYMDI